MAQPHKSSLEVWEHIRELDEVENWAERNRVVSKSDHLLYNQCAQVGVRDLGGGDSYVVGMDIISISQPLSKTVQLPCDFFT